MTRISFEIPDDLAAHLLAMPEEDRNRIAVATLQTQRHGAFPPPSPLADIDAALDELARLLPPGTPPLSDEALTRAGIYEDHL